MEDIDFTFPSEESDALVPSVCEPANIMISIMKERNTLVVYEEKLSMVGSHRAVIQHKDSFQKCIARPFESLDEAVRIYDLLMICQHPNLLSPIGLWACEDDLCFDKAKIEKDVNGDDNAMNAKKNQMKIKAFITFPNFDGAVLDISRKEMFLVDDDGSKTTTAYGFTCQGSKLFCQILDVVEYINGLYGASLPLSPLRVNSRRIVYKKVSEGQYQVMLWADFFNDLPKNLRRKTKSGKYIDPTIDDIQSANLSSIGTYLNNWLKECKVTANKELEQLSKKLDGKTLNFNDLKWEPGLWSVDIKILFIREIFWCIDNETARENTLKEKLSLGLKDCISNLGFDLQDANLFDSIMFLRKKIVAHQDSLYRYGGKEDDVGSHNQVIEIKIQKGKADYMINLVKEMRQLNWIKDSPLVRSSTSYINPFKHPTCQA